MTKGITILKPPETAVRRRRLTHEEEGVLAWRKKGPCWTRSGRDCIGLVTTDDAAVESPPEIEQKTGVSHPVPAAISRRLGILYRARPFVNPRALPPNLEPLGIPG